MARRGISVLWVRMFSWSDRQGSYWWQVLKEPAWNYFLVVAFALLGAWDTAHHRFPPTDFPSQANRAPPHLAWYYWVLLVLFILILLILEGVYRVNQRAKGADRSKSRSRLPGSGEGRHDI